VFDKLGLCSFEGGLFVLWKLIHSAAAVAESKMHLPMIALREKFHLRSLKHFSFIVWGISSLRTSNVVRNMF